MSRNNHGQILAAAFEQADRITRNVEALPDDGGQLRQLLDHAFEEARQAREDLETYLQEVPSSQGWALLLLLQRELTKTLKLYRFAATAGDAMQRRATAMRMRDHEQFRQAVRDTIQAAQLYLG